MDKIEALIQKIEGSREAMEFSGPQSEESVATLERALGVNLPPSYKQFLLRFGASGILPVGIWGIYGNDPLMPNEGCAFGETTRLRQEFNLPERYVVVNHDGDYEVVDCLDTSKPGAGGECPVISYELSSGHETKQNRSFAEYFEQYLVMWCDG